MPELSDLQGVSAQELRSQVGKILSSPFFSQSARLSRFLDYVVDKTINGQSDRLKGYTIGVEVFDRDKSFDPSIDAIVRVEAGRLRSKLLEYYQTDGLNDPVLIELPKGNYSPLFKKSRTISQEMKRQDTMPADVYIGREYPANSIAVLPFRYLSAAGNNDYLSDGMTDAIICSLAKEKSLRVISLTSVMRFKNTNIPIRQIAEELKVSHILEGSVVRDDDNIRITTQLIDARTDYHIWGESFERKTQSILEIQREISDDVRSKLVQKILDEKDVSGKESIDAKAYEAYLLGRKIRAKFTKKDFYQAADYFKEAISIEPDYAAAYTGLASCYCGLGSHGFELECPNEIIPQGLEYAHKALELDRSFVDAHTYLGIMKLKYEWDWPGADACFKKALSISPNDSRAHLQYSMYFESLGEYSEAINEAQQAYLVDPISKEVNMNLAWQYYQAGMLPESEQCLNHLLEIEPGFWGAYWDLGHIFMARGKHDEAIAAFQKAYEAGGGFFIPLKGLGYAYAMSGQTTKAKDMIRQLKEIQKNNYVSPFYFATIYMGLNDTDKTFEYLEKAYQDRSRLLAWLKVAKEFKPLHADPRFQDLVKRVGIPG